MSLTVNAFLNPTVLSSKKYLCSTNNASDSQRLFFNNPRETQGQQPTKGSKGSSKLKLQVQKIVASAAAYPLVDALARNPSLVSEFVKKMAGH